MKKAVVYVLVLLGFLSLGVAIRLAPTLKTGGEVAGSYFPAVLLLGIGFYLRRSEVAPKSNLLILFGAGIPLALIAYVMPMILASRIHREDTRTAWTYRSVEHNFSLTLPSDQWREVQREDATVSFYNQKRAILLGVVAQKESLEEFRKQSVKELNNHIANHPDDYTEKPQMWEGESPAGNPCILWTTVAKADKGGEVAVVFGLVWCKDKSLTLKFVSEGKFTMRSSTGKAGEKTFLNDTIKEICLSAK